VKLVAPTWRVNISDRSTEENKLHVAFAVAANATLNRKQGTVLTHHTSVLHKIFHRCRRMWQIGQKRE
jgi:hypothetical protein